jgi:hypothetical protein
VRVRVRVHGLCACMRVCVGVRVQTRVGIFSADLR